jgi:thioredoxin-dependent peroxiredoxin
MNAVVLGVSPDSAKSHHKFREKHGLPYNLLVDEGHELAERYGIWVEKKMYGVRYMGVQRTTVIIDKQGRIAKIFPKVQLDGHVEEVARAVSEIP